MAQQDIQVAGSGQVTSVELIAKYQALAAEAERRAIGYERDAEILKKHSFGLEQKTDLVNAIYFGEAMLTMAARENRRLQQQLLAMADLMAGNKAQEGGAA